MLHPEHELPRLSSRGLKVRPPFTRPTGAVDETGKVTMAGKVFTSRHSKEKFEIYFFVLDMLTYFTLG
jgi:hypothetical protein